MKQRTIQTLFNYWDSVRAGRLAPRRLDIEPSRIAGILAETFMLERIDGDDYTYRLAGTRLCELFGCELRGTSFLSDWTGEDRHILEQQMAAVCSEGAVAHLTIEAGIDARHRIEFEAVLLPLLHTGSNIGRVIGAMSPTSQPHWLDKGRLSGLRLVRHELIGPHGRRNYRDRLAGRQAPFLPALTGVSDVQSHRRRFRVVDGGLAHQKHGKS